MGNKTQNIQEKKEQNLGGYIRELSEITAMFIHGLSSGFIGILSKHHPVLLRCVQFIVC